MSYITFSLVYYTLYIESLIGIYELSIEFSFFFKVRDTFVPLVYRGNM